APRIIEDSTPCLHDALPILYLADARTGRIERKLVSSAGEADFESLRFLTSGAAFSPDGRRLAFVAKSGGEDALYVLDVERSRVRSEEHTSELQSREKLVCRL